MRATDPVTSQSNRFASRLEAAALLRLAGKARGAPERSVRGYVSTGAHEQRSQPDRAVVTGCVNGYRAAVVGAAAVVVLATGCELSEPPDLLAVEGLMPRVVSAGDRLELSGHGFPEGRQATLIFRGDVYRAGSPAIRDVRLKLAAVSHSESLVTAEIDEVTEHRFCEGSDANDHATFRGDIRVAFAARGSAPPVVGTLRGTSLDVVPSDLTAEDIQLKEQQGRRILQYLGVAGAPADAPNGIVLSQVAPGSPADAAGLRAGDVLLSFDDVAVRSTADLRPPHGRRTAALEVRRGGSVSVVEIDMAAVNPRGPSDLSGAAVMLGVACLLSLLWMSPLPAVLTWIERRIQVRAERRRATTKAGSLPWFRREPTARYAESFIRAALAAALFAPLCRGKAWFAEHQEVAALYALSSVLLVVMRLICGGLRKGGGWSFTRGMAAAFQTVAFALPGALAIVALGMVIGSLSPSDIIDAQGVFPWQWNGLKNPGLFVAMFVFLAALLPNNADGDAWAELEDSIAAAGSSTGLERVHENVDRFRTLVCAALVTLLFLGGSSMPHGFDEPGLPRIAAAIGPLLFIAKTAALMATVSALRSLIGRLPLDAPAVFAYKWLLPLSLAAAVVAIFWAEAAARLEADAIAGAALCGLVVTAAALIFYRLRKGASAVAAQVSVNPWL